MRTRAILLVMGTFLVLAPSAWPADKKEDLYRKAKIAEDQQKAEDAARLYCEVAKIDPGYKDAQSMCSAFTEEAKRQAAHSDQRFNDGVAAFQKGSIDDAEQAFKNVVAGAHVSEAQQYLVKIRSERQTAASQAEQADDANFAKGSQAYQQNDFAGARAALRQVSGKHAAEAQQLLQQMSRYEQLMTSGDTALASGNLQGALANYRDAATVKHDGPGDPVGKGNQLQANFAERQKNAATPPTTSAAAPPVVTTKPAVPIGVSKPQIQQLLLEAAVAQKKGDLKTAKAKYQDVVVADPSNIKAIRALVELDNPGSKGGDAAKTAESSRAEALLATGLREFYVGNYEVAEVRLQDYLNTYSLNNAQVKKALAHFYLGVSKVTRYYLNAPGSADNKLLLEAQFDFRLAAQTPRFVPPSSAYISPKVLAAYSDSTK